MGTRGTVYLPVPASKSGVGKVHVSLQNRTMEYKAITSQQQLPTGAKIVVVGVCMESDRSEPMLGILKELNVQYVLGYTPEEFAYSLRLIAEGTVDAASLVTGSVGIDGVAKAFDDLANPEAHTKIIVEPWR